MEKAIRLDKFLSDAGMGTRSEVKKSIQKGRVQVDKTVVKRPEYKVQIPGNRVSLDGEEVQAAPSFTYYLLYKPAGFVSAVSDSRERTVMELVPQAKQGLFPVGRLDKDTEGLLLITDDGALAHRLLSPKKHVDKTYFAKVAGIVTQEDVHRMAEGVDIGEEKKTLPARLEILTVSSEEGSSEIRLTICEGKFHQVKRMMEAVGKKVLYLKRISMGPIALPDDLEKGRCRPLTKEEAEALKGIGENRQEI